MFLVIGRKLKLEKISFYAKNLIMSLKQKGERVCCAESCTGGMITAALTEIPGSSSVLSRGFVTYSNQSKIDMLGVKLKTLELHGAVSGQTVSEMASGAITASNGEADYAIAVSGVAGPDGGNKEKPVGLVYICILKKGDVGEIKKYSGGDEVSNLGFKRVNGARLLMIIDTIPPLYGKRDGVAHAGFSSFELYYGPKPIFVNCGGGSKFGHQYRKYCQSSKAHNVLLLNEKSQCSFGKKPFSRNNSYYYIKDGPRNTKMNFERSITEKIVELSHDAYKKDYGVSINRKLSMDLVKNCLIGNDVVISDGDPKRNLIEASFSIYFHLHPSIICTKKRGGVLLEIPGDKKMFFSYKGGKLRFEKSTYIGNFFEPQEITRLVIEKNVEQSDSKINWKIEEFID